MQRFAAAAVLSFAMVLSAQESAPTAPANAPAQQPPAGEKAPPAEPQTAPAENKPAAAQEKSSPAPERKESPREQAWQVLLSGIHNKSTDRRAHSVGVLGLIPNDLRARKLAFAALEDKEPNVRIAAATAVGQMGARQAIPKLKDLLDDPETGVVLAAAKALLQLHNNAGYEVYYAVLTGERKPTGPFIQRQMKILKDPKQLAQIGFEEGIGFVPFAGMGYTAYKMLTKDESSPVRAAAARALADDPDPQSGDALAQAASDKSWIVRKAALDAIAMRGERKLMKAAIPQMDDDKDIVMYTAAATVIHLSDPHVRMRRVSLK